MSHIAGSRLLIGLVGSASKLLLQSIATIKVTNGDALYAAIREAPPRRPLITVSNHSSAYDDPLLLSAMLTHGHIWTGRMRWALGARDVLIPRCCSPDDPCPANDYSIHFDDTRAYFSRLWSRLSVFPRRMRNYLLQTFFEGGQVLLINRSGGNRPACAHPPCLGVYQPTMNRALRLLNHNHWVHVFPEGKIVPDARLGSPPGRLKWGVGRLVLEADIAPILIPFVHFGMENVKPLGKWIRLWAPPIHVHVGNPIDTDVWRQQATLRFSEPRDQRSWITDQIALRLAELYPRRPPLSLDDSPNV